MKKTIFTLLIVFLFFYSCKTTQEVPQPQPQETPEPVEVVEEIPKEIEVPEIPQKDEVKWDPNTPKNIEEFRAAWVATVANINWPSKPGLSTSEQQKEALELLDFLEEHNPWALKDMSERMLEAIQRGMWNNPSKETIEALKEIYKKSDNITE